MLTSPLNDLAFERMFYLVHSTNIFEFLDVQDCAISSGHLRGKISQ